MNAHRLLFCVVAAVLMSALPASAQMTISWNNNAQPYEGRDTVTVACAPNGNFGQVWGAGIYTADSSICTAAVHAGIIQQQRGGRVLVKMRAGLQSYVGTSRNGVTTQNYGAWDQSFSVSRPPPPPPDPEPVIAPPPTPAPAPKAPEIPSISWSQDARRLAPNGRRFTYACPARGTAAPVKGGDVYSWDSSICTAAVHAGMITVAKGGVVTIEMRPGSRTYNTLTRNGITSLAGPATTLGFIVVRPAEARR
jgi:hypothetical protein